MIYVDEIINYHSGPWCHMATDGDIKELHEMARKIGLIPPWFQNEKGLPHYDLRPSKRKLAILNGAKSVDGQELFEKCFKPIRDKQMKEMEIIGDK